MRFLIAQSLRRDEICRDPSRCERGKAKEIRDSDGHLIRYEPCIACPSEHLEAAMRSEAGALIRSAVELEFLLDSKVTVEMDAIAADEWVALKILKEEKYKHEEENKKR